jgi:hypothetical protein
VQRRAAGWQVGVGVLSFSAIVQCAGMAIVVCFPCVLQGPPSRSNAMLTRLGIPL